jgi:hypothetical protein
MEEILRQGNYRVEAPKNAEDLSVALSGGEDFDLAVFDGNLWGDLTWIKIRKQIQGCLVEDGRLICVSASDLTEVASRLFGQPVEYAGKDPGKFAELILEPQLVY